MTKKKKPKVIVVRPTLERIGIRQPTRRVMDMEATEINKLEMRCGMCLAMDKGVKIYVVEVDSFPPYLMMMCKECKSERIHRSWNLYEAKRGVPWDGFAGCS